MPKRALDNPLVLAILGLLLERPMHPYDVLGELRRRSETQAAVITRGSVYDIVAALNTAGWVAETARLRQGNRPERTVYALTDAGRDELVRRLDEQIRNPRRDFTPFVGAVAYLGALGPDGAADALTERAERLRERTAADEQNLAGVLDQGLPRLYMIEAEYALHQARSELAWIDATIEEIRAGRLPWPAPATEEGP
ncbi:PadR family transcriptional regulator [Actinoplanes lobatus]|uniref:PadR family transcriptional regulator n=1 Tax=Actinoplanes lobatus TaxID=113568 RepID=A0A7W7HLF9_9ACTN|nr:PadR family transcriptional regulator [Actinoplanes lobatus]MBB4752713.1 DNA-binding PadR family transcriptional regulator [Actinoplanes lobatus]GGN90664.1 PadR family transcriptional regulator [Actinoplanes lobatus]GIE43949.1 PadR family transcriptional regulator [Actinoplanes lobatus]